MNKEILNELYRHKLTLLTDLYQLTMAYGYWKSGLYDRSAIFHLYYRKQPFGGPLAISCGLQPAIEYLQQLSFSTEDIHYLGRLKGADGQALFDESFLNYLQRFRFRCDVDAIPEGKVVFPNEPLLRVKGPLLQAQLVETALLNIVNFSTLIASKAARIRLAAAGDSVIDFGLRRAQGIDGALSASRAAYIGGCQATSNVLAGKLYDIPVRGTHAHSWVMSFDSEPEAFTAYSKAMPNNCILLVDTYDTIQGVRNAIQTARELRQAGHEIIGIRLDSGDLAALSITARGMLDEAGFANARIFASDSLDEHKITALKTAGARIDGWGVGTRLVTGKGQGALGGVYKLAAIQNAQGQWEDRVKLSENPIKTSNPGCQQVRRVLIDGQVQEDIIYDLLEPLKKPLPAGEDLLVPIFREGQLVYNIPSIHDKREQTKEELSLFNRLVDGDYKVSLENGLAKRKALLIQQKRGAQQKA
ncbi:MAG: nicotinate phosphoribosyltransferase, partial [Bacteroidota bacterium]